MCTTGSRLGSSEFIPSVRVPRQRFIPAGNLIACSRNRQVGWQIGTLRRGKPLQQPDPLAIGHGCHQWNHFLGAQLLEHTSEGYQIPLGIIRATQPHSTMKLIAVSVVG